jgi:ATP-dependent Clp protease ATP-binding subunit ClpC
MTSNVGARLISKGKSLGFMPAEDREKDYREMKDTVMDEVKRVFNPEFINRIDEIIVFKPLTVADMEKILDLNLKKVDKKLEAKGVKFTITKAAKAHLIEKGFDPNYGARPILRTVQRMLEDPLAEFLLTKQVTKGGTVKVDYKGPGEDLDLCVA